MSELTIAVTLNKLFSRSTTTKLAELLQYRLSAGFSAKLNDVSYQLYSRA